MVLTVKFIAENSNGMVKVNLLGKPQFDHIVSDDDSEIDLLSMERQIALNDVYEIIKSKLALYNNVIYEIPPSELKRNKYSIKCIGKKWKSVKVYFFQDTGKIQLLPFVRIWYETFFQIRTGWLFWDIEITIGDKPLNTEKLVPMPEPTEKLRKEMRYEDAVL